MPYSQNEKPIDLDMLATLADDDVIVVGDASDDGNAKAITKEDFADQLGSQGTVKVTDNDTTPGVLNDKLTMTSEDGSVIITQSVLNPNADETQKFDFSIPAMPISPDSGIVAARAYKSSAVQSVPNGNVATLVTLDAEDFDTEGNFASNRFTATVAGYYIVNASVYYQDVEDTYSYLLSIYKNGSPTITSGNNASTNDPDDDLVVIGSDIVFLDVGDYIELYASHYGTTANDVKNVSTGTFLAVIRVAAPNNRVGSYAINPLVPFTGSAQTKTLDDNTEMRVVLINIPTTIQVSKISSRIQAATVAGTLSYALYSEDGADLLIDETTTSINSTGVHKHTLSDPVTLEPGNYYFCVHPNGSAELGLLAFDVLDTVNFNPSGEPILCGSVTITADTTPSTIDPNAITPDSADVIVNRFDI